MEYVLGIIVVIFIIVIFTLIFRKRVNNEIDYYENWKVDIMGRDVAGKLTRIKKLNLEGEAKEKLDRWKEAWDTILIYDLATVEQTIIDARQATSRFQMNTARKSITVADEQLNDIERKINRIETDVDQLIATDKMNREEVERIEPEIDRLHKRLLHERNRYDRSVIQYEARMEQMRENIRLYEELVEAGTYSEASEIVAQLTDEVNHIEQSMDDFPNLYHKCKFNLPTELDEMYKNVQQMELQGYYLDHLHIKNKINDLQARLLEYVVTLEETATEEVKQLLPETEKEIDDIYERLEEEVLAKNFIQAKANDFSSSLEQLLNEFVETKAEIDELKKTYHFENEAIETFITLEKRMTRLSERQQSFAQKSPSEYASTALRDELTVNMEKFTELTEEHRVYKEEVANLRKDELNAREQINQMSIRLNEMKRQLRISNLPGIPAYIKELLEDASNKHERAIAAVEKQPLDIVQLQKTLEEANVAVENISEQTDEMYEQATLTEMVIQYANRYRSRDSLLAAKLLEAEQLFRKADYASALTHASEAIEAKEPGALSHIKTIYENEVK